MGAKTISKGLYAVLGVVVLFIAYGAFKPAPTRGERAPEPAPAPDSGTGPAIAEDVLQVPPALQAMSGIQPDPNHGVWFIPYAVINEEQGIAMVRALRAELLRGNPFPERLQVPDGQGAGEREFLFPTEPGVARFYMGDINSPETGASESRIPLIISQPHPDDYSADVLFLDGHLEPVPVGRFPLSKRFLAALSALDTPEHEELDSGAQ